MKVADMIDKLKRFPAGARVRFWVCEEGEEYLVDIGGVTYSEDDDEVALHRV